MKYYIFFTAIEGANPMCVERGSRKEATIEVRELKEKNYAIWKIIRGEEIKVNEELKVSFSKLVEDKK